MFNSTISGSQDFSCYFLVYNGMNSIDPLGRPTVTAGSDHCFQICCPSVRPNFSKSSKTKQIFQVKPMFTIGKIVGAAKWIIDDTCLVMSAMA